MKGANAFLGETNGEKIDTRREATEYNKKRW